MAGVKEFRVMVASDGSLAATAATVIATCLPWPAGTRADADLLIVGATGASQVRRLLLGSVAQGAPVPERYLWICPQWT